MMLYSCWHCTGKLIISRYNKAHCVATVNSSFLHKLSDVDRVWTVCIVAAVIVLHTKVFTPSLKYGQLIFRWAACFIRIHELNSYAVNQILLIHLNYSRRNMLSLNSHQLQNILIYKTIVVLNIHSPFIFKGKCT